MAKYVVGIDEVGRGPVAGPVTVCAVVLPKGFSPYLLRGVKDSKKMTEFKREQWYERAVGWRKSGLINFYIRSVSAKEIDKNGIERAIKKAIRGTLSRVDKDAGVFLDGRLSAPARFKKQETIIKGDEKKPVISLASVVAKVHRDRYMEKMGEKYPKYGFETHKGYGTKAHLKAVKKHGKCAIHRKSFLKNL